MPRSMRVIAVSPHTCAMSVAFDDHGDTVPMRGVIDEATVSTVSSRRLGALRRFGGP